MPVIEMSCVIICIWLLIADTPCPLYENDKIIQQPADFLTLSESYSSAATGFIHQMTGTYLH